MTEYLLNNLIEEEKILIPFLSLNKITCNNLKYLVEQDYENESIFFKIQMRSLLQRISIESIECIESMLTSKPVELKNDIQATKSVVSSSIKVNENSKDFKTATKRKKKNWEEFIFPESELRESLKRKLSNKETDHKDLNNKDYSDLINAIATKITDDLKM